MKAGSWNYGRSNTDPWVRHEIQGTVVEVPRSAICTKVFARLREKHTLILAKFIPCDFISDLHHYMTITRVVKIGRIEVNKPPAELCDEEAWLF